MGIHEIKLLGSNRLTYDDSADFLDHRGGSGGTIEIFDIQVSSERRKGRGRLLIEHLLRKVSKEWGKEVRVWAITRAENIIAQKFYEALQFDSIPLRRFYSSEKNVDAIMYVRSAGGPV